MTCCLPITQHLLLCENRTDGRLIGNADAGTARAHVNAQGTKCD